MVLDLIRDKNYNSKVIASDIHGKHPYKLYLELLGNSNIGRYIVVVSNQPLNKGKTVDEISIKLDKTEGQIKNVNTSVIKPNTSTVNGYYVTYRVKESNILEVGNTPILVYKSAKEK